ncbi:uncharacterized protein LOC136061925 [Quercus suber]|uniref:uncharacterized protein LOC136061925 n=1 Tax=Quercus suber TaxID=58331 RepID=UPI0032DE3780
MKSRRCTQTVAWAPPPASRYKINVDGAVFKSQRTAGVGVVVRDCQGQVVAAMSKKINAPLGPLEAEAKAFEAGTQFAKDVGIQDFIIEGDSLVLYNALCGNTPPPASVAAVVLGMKMMCGDCVDFSHIRRQGNKPAHLLAKHALSIVDFIAWIEENPSFLAQALNHDVLFLS